jgi:hypothetical protein
MNSYEYWRDRTTGHVLAVKLHDGVVVGCCGPFTRTQLEERFLPTLDYGPEQADWVDAHRDQYDPYPPAPAAQASRP